MPEFLPFRPFELSSFSVREVNILFVCFQDEEQLPFVASGERKNNVRFAYLHIVIIPL